MLTHDLGDGAHLRLWEEADVEELYAVTLAEAGRLRRWMPWAVDPTVEHTREFIAMSRRTWLEGTGYQCAITVDGAIAGSLGLGAIDRRNESANLGYWIAGFAEGRGIVTRACTAMLDHGFGTLGLHRVSIAAAPENARSRAVARRLGFQEEGVERDREKLGDGWLDHVMHGMLAPDWAARAAAGR